MIKALRMIRNYICYCGIEKEEFKAVKKDAYASNFQIWRRKNIIINIYKNNYLLNIIFNEYFN